MGTTGNALAPADASAALLFVVGVALQEADFGLRLIHYSAWLARRWNDPAFPHNFPWFNTPRYWEEQILALREQAALLDEYPLEWID